MFKDWDRKWMTVCFFCHTTGGQGLSDAHGARATGVGQNWSILWKVSKHTVDAQASEILHHQVMGWF